MFCNTVLLMKFREDKGLLKVANRNVDGTILFISLVPLLDLLLNFLGHNPFDVAANLHHKLVKVILETHHLDGVIFDNGSTVEGDGVLGKQLGYDLDGIVDKSYISLDGNSVGANRRNVGVAMDGCQFIVVQNMGFLDLDIMHKVGVGGENTELVLGRGLVVDNDTVIRGGHFGNNLLGAFKKGYDDSVECRMKKVGWGASIFFRPWVRLPFHSCRIP